MRLPTFSPCIQNGENPRLSNGYRHDTVACWRRSDATTGRNHPRWPLGDFNVRSCQHVPSSRQESSPAMCNTMTRGSPTTSTTRASLTVDQAHRSGTWLDKLVVYEPFFVWLFSECEENVTYTGRRSTCQAGPASLTLFHRLKNSPTPVA